MTRRAAPSCLLLFLLAGTAAAGVRAHVRREEGPADDEGYPAGTRRVRVVAQLGDLRFDHVEYHVPPGLDARRRWDFAKAALPGGGTLIGSSLNWHSGNRGYSPWSFLRIQGTPPAAEKPIELLKPSICVAAAAFEGEGWAAVELVFERPVRPDLTVRLALRLKRLAGDPWVCLQFQGDPAASGLSLGGYPNATHPIVYGLRTRYPRNAAFLTRERWVWAAGQDWNLHDRQQAHALPLVPGAPGGVMFYNRHNSETGGMLAVFLPERMRSVEAAGTYGVTVGFALRQPAARLALREWYDWRGWQPVREEFVASLPDLVARLRGMSFAWPMADPLGRDACRADSLLDFTPSRDEDLLPVAAEKQAVRQARAAYAAATAQLGKTDLEDTPRRYAAERAAIVAADAVRRAMQPLMRRWLERGGVFEENPTP